MKEIDSCCLLFCRDLMLRVRRLMRSQGLLGVVRGRRCRTTIGDDEVADRPLARVKRQFTATRPNQLWVADIVRHEAPCKRVGVRDLNHLAVAVAGVKLRAASLEMRGSGWEQP